MHTFRLRRRAQTGSTDEQKKRYHALQAMAVRDKTIYVFGRPSLRTCPVTMYLDVESTGEGGFTYLIGLVVIENGTATRYSFWADAADQETAIFEQFLDVATKYPDFLMFAYGSHERTFLKRMHKLVERKGAVDKVFGSPGQHTLSLIYAHFYFPTYSNGLEGSSVVAWDFLPGANLTLRAFQ